MLFETFFSSFTWAISRGARAPKNIVNSPKQCTKDELINCIQSFFFLHIHTKSRWPNCIIWKIWNLLAKKHEKVIHQIFYIKHRHHVLFLPNSSSVCFFLLVFINKKKLFKNFNELDAFKWKENKCTLLQGDTWMG